MKKDKLIIGIQGGKGSFNEQALGFYVEEDKAIGDYQVKYLYTTERVLTELNEGRIDLGQFAIHNSTGGMVQESIYAMAKHKFKIIKEFAIEITHHLMKKSGANTKTIDTIMAHPQVFKQCKKSLAAKYPNLELKVGDGDLIDHAKVAEALHNDELPENIAVLGPQILSELYDLDIIESNLQDMEQNLTSFLIVSR